MLNAESFFEAEPNAEIHSQLQTSYSLWLSVLQLQMCKQLNVLLISPLETDWKHIMRNGNNKSVNGNQKSI